MLVESETTVKIKKACCVLHNFVRRHDGLNSEDSQSFMQSSPTRYLTGVENSPTNAKDVRKYFVQYIHNKRNLLVNLYFTYDSLVVDVSCHVQDLRKSI
ncbi:putative nuclease HARBI1 [Aphis craccivora]|uniref:Putative nuclease HARBI1 n=1 Tax=Aphis craccivora TaxID=307492 RepID=A0A6G0WAW6_APHCR|nr:putative nuclease HARBI1 [Aphis craccivora]